MSAHARYTQHTEAAASVPEKIMLYFSQLSRPLQAFLGFRPSPPTLFRSLELSFAWLLPLPSSCSRTAQRLVYLWHLRPEVDLLQVDGVRFQVVEQLAQQHPVPQGLRQVEHLRRVGSDPVVRWQHVAADQPHRALSPVLHGVGEIPPKWTSPVTYFKPVSRMITGARVPCVESPRALASPLEDAPSCCSLWAPPWNPLSGLPLPPLLLSQPLSFLSTRLYNPFTAESSMQTLFWGVSMSLSPQKVPERAVITLWTSAPYLLLQPMPVQLMTWIITHSLFFR